MKPFFPLTLILILLCILSGNPQEPKIDLSGFEIDSLTAQKLIGKFVALKDDQLPQERDRQISEFTLELAQEKGKALIFQMLRSAGLDTTNIFTLKEYPEDDPEDMEALNYIVLKSKANGQPYILTEAVNPSESFIQFCHIEFENDVHVSFYIAHPKGLEELFGEFARIR